MRLHAAIWFIVLNEIRGLIVVATVIAVSHGHLLTVVN